MPKIVLDWGTVQILVFLFIFLFSTIGFFFVKRNRLFGIRVRATFESEEIWHKVHVIAAIVTIPFDIILVCLLFIKSSLTKSILAFVVSFIILFIYLLIPKLVTRKYYEEKKIKEAKELEEQIKRESGWR